ncbi:MAG TPA: VanZ family protein [Gallionellaceae bacterium]
MSDHPSHRTHLRRYLAGGYALFIVYASLAPFTGWQEQGVSLLEVMTAPLAQTFTWFDFVINLLAYLPFGFLLQMLLRPHLPPRSGLVLALLLGCGMSLLMEYAQLYLPSRVSSNSDLLSNSMGVLLGALLALRVEAQAWFARLRRWYDGRFRRGGSSDFGAALLAMWVFVQLNPSLPMLGSVFISQMAPTPFEAAQAQPFNWLEALAVALNLLMPGVLLLILLRQPRHALNLLVLALALVTLAKFVIAAVLLKSWALLLWVNSESMLGVLAGLILLAVARYLRPGWLLGMAMLAVLAYIALAHWVMDSNMPAGTLRLFHWHYGHMLHYNGLSQLLALLFPLLLLGYLVWVMRQKRR